MRIILENILESCGSWLREKLHDANASGIVLGLSGGIDSALLAAIGEKFLGRDSVMCIIMPCHSDSNDESDAMLMIEKFNLRFMRVDLTSAFDSIISEFAARGENISRISQSNLKARLRMSTLYTYAQTHNYLVCGTSNKSEFLTGYFTKYGDSGVDLMPLADFLKRDVREFAKVLGVPEKIISKAPSAGLYAGQTDENDMGFTYEILDEYLATGNISDQNAKAKIDRMRKVSEHKRKPIPIFRNEI